MGGTVKAPNASIPYRDLLNNVTLEVIPVLLVMVESTWGKKSDRCMARNHFARTFLSDFLIVLIIRRECLCQG